MLAWHGTLAGAIASPPISESTSSPTPRFTEPADTRLVATTFLFVSPLLGNDNGGDGSQRSPLRTLTRALQVAQPGTVISLSPGLYSSDTGEQFPLQLQPGVTVQGDASSHGRGIVIRGSGSFLSPTFARQNVTMLGADNATLTGVTVTNPEGRGYGLWIESSHPTVTHNTFSQNVHDGIAVTGASNPVIQNNYFQRNGANGITIYGTSQPQVVGNVFEDTGFGINVGQQAAPVLLDNRIWNNRSGVIVQGQAQPVLRRNVMEYNEQDGLVAIAQSRPDLGTTADPGQNRFSHNGQYAINAEVALNPVIAIGNTLDVAQVSGSVSVIQSPTPVATASTHVTSPTTVSPTEPRVEQLPRAIAPPPQSQVTPTNAPVASDTLPDTTALSPQVLNDITNIPVAPAVPPPVTPSTDLASTPSTPVAESDRSILSILLPVPNSPENASPLLNGLGNELGINEPETVEIVGIPTPDNTSSISETEADTVITSAGEGDRSILSILLPVPDAPPNTNALLDNQPMLSGSTGGTDHLIAPDAIEIPVILPGEAAVDDGLSHELSADNLSDRPAGNTDILSLLSPPSSSTTPAQSLPSLAVAAAPSSPLRSTPNPVPSQPPSNLLPVPGMVAPEGHLGSLSPVSVQANTLNNALLSSVPSLADNGGALGRRSLRYRVLVNATDEARRIVIAFAPDAFVTRVNGQPMLQVGAYSALENANAIARQLVNYGLQVEVQRMN
ncbi:MAG: DUF1565 domain-containing protein [Cyanothece sp. SIO2G6]|nr:DUF1565 domain-containing protein [Cyanothece sp. SIO2G6]